MSGTEKVVGPRALALDLGSSYVKAAVLDGDERLARVVSGPAPALEGEQGIREGDAEAYLAVVRAVLGDVCAGLPSGLPLGIASQRSTFVLWSRRDGRPIRPMVSWQDTRGADWCAAHGDLRPEVFARTGLQLSAHYAGPKLAAMLERHAELAATLRGGDVLFGTLECYAMWQLANEPVHRIDSSMAARTAMLDLSDLSWSRHLLEAFRVPESILPRVGPSRFPELPCRSGPRITASVADQAAGGLAALRPGGDEAWVNLGTGGFVLRPASGPGERVAGFLTAPIVDAAPLGRRFVVEGAIGGAGTAVDRFGRGPTELPANDPSPRAFCLPDVAGLGAPYWRPDLRFTLSPEAEALAPACRRRIALEGVLFRVRQVLDGLRTSHPWSRVLLSGGLARDPFVGRGLAAVLQRDVERLEMTEGILTGTTRLAAGLEPYRPPRTVRCSPGAHGGYLADKYRRWSNWVASLVER